MVKAVQGQMAQASFLNRAAGAVNGAACAVKGKVIALTPFLASKVTPVAPAQKSLVQKIATFISNVFSAIRTCLSYIPLIGRVFARPVAPVVVQQKPSVPTLMANAVKNAFATSTKFVADHKVAFGATVALGAATYFGGKAAVDFVNSYFASATPATPAASGWMDMVSEHPYATAATAAVVVGAYPTVKVALWAKHKIMG